MRNFLKNHRSLRVFVYGIGFLVLLGVAIRLSLPSLGCALMRHDSVMERPDLYVLLMGDRFGQRAMTASQAYKDLGPAPVVLGQTEPSEFELAGIELSESQRNVQLLGHKGIPPENLYELQKPFVTSTVEEATQVRQWAENRFAGRKDLRIVIISSWSHTRRAHWIFSRVWHDWPQTQLMSYASEQNACRTWWRKEESAIAVVMEYIKWIYYLTHY